jgi:apolipoprotein N-acyltransferase
MRFLRVGVSFWGALGALGLALLGAVAFPPLGLWPLSLLSISLFLLLLRNRDTSEARNLGLLYGLLYSLGTMYWFLGIFGWLAVPLIAFMAAYFGLLGRLIGLSRGHSPLVRAALVGLFAVAVEWLRGDAWYLRFPWYTAPHALAQSPAWVAAARWVGLYGLSFLVWLIAGLGAFGRIRYWLAFLLLPAFWLVLPAPAAPDRRALLVQAEGPSLVETVLPTIPSEKVDLAVLPEYSYFTSPQAALSSSRGPGMLARRLGCPVVFGAVEDNFGADNFHNVAGVSDAEGNLRGTFPKQRPVPLLQDGLPGRERPVFPLEQGTLGVAICYDYDAPEVAASLVRSGATVLVNPSMDSMHWGRTQHEHHELLLRLRAVENDRWILRAASSGRTEAIDPRGVPSAEGVAIGEVDTLTVPYGHRGGVSLGGQAHVLGPAAAAGTVLVLLVYGANFLRTRRQARAVSKAEEKAAGAGLRS